MKKVKSFNVGDKVFAKVKGYPAWPAKVSTLTFRFDRVVYTICRRLLDRRYQGEEIRCDVLRNQRNVSVL